MPPGHSHFVNEIVVGLESERASLLIHWKRLQIHFAGTRQFHPIVGPHRPVREDHQENVDEGRVVDKG